MLKYGCFISFDTKLNERESAVFMGKLMKILLESAVVDNIN